MTAPENLDSIVARASRVGNGFAYASIILRRTSPPLVIVHTLCPVRTWCPR